MVTEQSGFYRVETEEGQAFVCTLRGRLKEEAQTSDLAAIGDRVLFTPIEDEDGVAVRSGVIEEVLPRETALSRSVRTSGKRGVNQSEREQVLIANATQAFFVQAASQPGPNFRMLDRMLVAGETSDIPRLCIIVNKMDLLTDTSDIDAQFAPYRRLGYDVFFTSAAQDIGIEAVREQLAGKISIFTGPSGVGKTSLLNRIQPGLGRAVKEISQYHAQGIHTTRDSVLVRLEGGGYLADTPGIRTMTVWDVEPDELEGYFREIGPVSTQCRFHDCTHTHEPGCAVVAGVKAGTISRTRYENFLHLRDELRETYIAY
ncbi:ribosome small subunit-dependent GTPase A [bacterium]|nr:ribosome small subunit-dependent GTPase A [bacterium]